MESLFVVGSCRICGGNFHTGRHEGHLEYHLDLFNEYRPERLELERRTLEQEKLLGQGHASSLTAESSRKKHGLANFLKHAKQYGTEEVYESAVPFLSDSELVLLGIELASMERGRKSSGGFSIGKRHRRSQAESIEAAQALRAAGLVPKAIANKLGLSEATTRGYLKLIAA